MTTARPRTANPRLGTYFSIVASVLVALVLIVMLLEQLAVSGAMLSSAILAVPILIYAAVGIASYNEQPLDYFAAGRRVPAVYSGLLLAMTGMGATCIVALTGAFFVIGFDALCIAIGGLAGFVITAVLMAPFLRKFGAFTLPSYLGRRFESRLVRLAASVAVGVPLLMLIVAELKLGGAMASLMSGFPQASMIAVLAAAIVLTVAAGGMRSATWSGVAQCIAAVLALLIPVAIVGVLLTNMPLPQLSHGPILRALGRDESSFDIARAVLGGLELGFPDQGLHPIAKRFAHPFGALSPLAFVVIMLSTMLAFASAPWLLPRVAATPSVYDTRKSIGWATVIFGIAMITLASIAVFMREYIHEVVKDPTQQVPAWLGQLAALDLAAVDTAATRLKLASVSLDRDAVLAALPLAADMPQVVLYVALAGAVAAALAAAGAATVALANVLVEDLVFGLRWEPAESRPRLIACRIAIGLVAALAALIAAHTTADPLRLWLWALAMTGSALFPVLVMSIWWKRLTTFGALGGIVTGFVVSGLVVASGEGNMLGLDGALSALVAVPLATLATIALSSVTPAPSRHALEVIRDIRVPGGEILYDREMRIARQKKIQRAGA